MVILKFMNPADASEFIEAYNGKPFNSMEVSNMSDCLFHNEFSYGCRLSQKYVMSSMFYPWSSMWMTRFHSR
jgi:hypothetical protein